MASNYYKGLIWTNHALKKIKERGISQDLAVQAFKNPDRTLRGREKGSFEFQKNTENSKTTVIAKKNEKNEWIIISVWIDPPFPETIDAKRKEEYKKYQKASFWKKVFLTVKEQLGF